MDPNKRSDDMARITTPRARRQARLRRGGNPGDLRKGYPRAREGQERLGVQPDARLRHQQLRRHHVACEHPVRPRGQTGREGQARDVRTQGCKVSVGRIGKLECDFILRNPEMGYAYVQVAMTIMADQSTEEREYRPFEQIRDNYPKYLLTRSDPIQQRRAGFPFFRKELTLGCGSWRCAAL